MATDLRSRRRADVRTRVLDAAWELAGRDGLTAWTLRDLAAAVGMRAPSLYTHFDDKDAIHDAMFEQGAEQLLAALTAVPAAGSPTDRLVAVTEAFLDFCTASVPRYQLLFTHVLGEWRPTPEAYGAAERAYAHMVEGFAAIGITHQADLDLWTALSAGLAAQQLANDRGGDRWRRLVPDAVEMFLTHTADRGSRS